MKLTGASSYALNAVVYMASQADPESAVASHEIAKAKGIPKRFLLKVLKPLVEAGILKSQKGPKGGYCLEKPAHTITVLEVIEAADQGRIEGIVPAFHTEDDPPRKLPNPLNPRLQAICQQAAEQVRDYLKTIPITDLVPRRGKKPRE